MMREDRESPDYVERKLEILVHHLEAMRIADYIQLLEKPGRLIMVNLVAGLARGLGIAIGASFIFALMIEILRRLIMLNIPGIGNFVAEVLRIVELKIGQY
mgnify:CR=1 FL=1